LGSYKNLCEMTYQ